MYQASLKSFQCNGKRKEFGIGSISFTTVTIRFEETEKVNK